MGSVTRARTRRRPGNSIRARSHTIGNPNATHRPSAESDTTSDSRSAVRLAGSAEERAGVRPGRSNDERHDREHHEGREASAPTTARRAEAAPRRRHEPPFGSDDEVALMGGRSPTAARMRLGLVAAEEGDEG